MARDVHTEILAAAERCMARTGISNTTVDDAAQEAGVARATVYRHFPGGREELVAETITFAVHRFIGQLSVRVDAEPDLAGLVTRTLMEVHQMVVSHPLLAKVLETEPERLQPHMSQAAPASQRMIKGFLISRVDPDDLRPGMTPDAAADWLSRMVLSFTVGTGGWNLGDEDEVRRLVEGHLLVPAIAS